MTFGFGTKEFEVTSERLGCYRPEEHIDNPKGYADGVDARQYDQRLRGPIDEKKELIVDPAIGLKTYIASEGLRIETSAGLVRKLLSECIQLGRKFSQTKDNKDLHEALRLLGTACHCLEDYSAHSNYVELALIELGERDVFPHVGRNTQIRLQGARGPVWPIVTGTFGGVDFFHSVTGEFDDKVTQSEIQELEGALQASSSQGQNASVLAGLLSKLPSGVVGGGNQAGKVNQLQQNAQQQAQQQQITPKRPEEWVAYIKNIRQQIYPVIQWHDELMMGISETIEKIPMLPDLLDSIQDQINMFVFSLLAPYLLPVIKQIKAELNTGSSEIIEGSKQQQHIVFNDDQSSDPTHSMLSKDHFSNVLNEPAGKVASQVLKWVVPQVVAAWDESSVNIDRTCNRIIRGVLHHPALRNYGEDGASDGRKFMFGVVEQWWNEKSSQEKSVLRTQLSREGVRQGRNHKEGVHDHGHGSGGKLAMTNMFRSVDGNEAGIGGAGGRGGGITAGTMAGGAGFGGLLAGGLAGAAGESAYDNRQGNTGMYGRSTYGEGNVTNMYGQSSDLYSGSRTDAYTHARRGQDDNYGQSQYSDAREEYDRPQTTSYSRFQQQEDESYSGRTQGYGQSRYQEENVNRYRGREEHEDRYERDERSERDERGYANTRDDEERDERERYGQETYGRERDNQNDREEEFNTEDRYEQASESYEY